MRNRIVFCKNEKIYEIKELDNLFHNNQINGDYKIFNKDKHL